MSTWIRLGDRLTASVSPAWRSLLTRCLGGGNFYWVWFGRGFRKWCCIFTTHMQYNHSVFSMATPPLATMGHRRARITTIRTVIPPVNLGNGWFDTVGTVAQSGQIWFTWRVWCGIGPGSGVGREW